MRPIWTGGISFSLIYIPVKMYSATEPVQLDLDYLSKNNKAPIRYARINKRTGEEVPWENIVKGFEIDKGNYVILDDDDFAAAAQKKSEIIEIEYFSNESEIDPKLYQKPYYLEPDKGAQKTYALLREALRKSEKVGVAEFVFRNKEHLVVLRPEDDVLLLNTLRYAPEIRPTGELKIPKSGTPDRKQLKTAVELINSMTEEFDLGDFTNDYLKKLKQIINDKAKNKKVSRIKKETETPKATDISEIMEKLQESLKDVQITKS